MDGTLGPHPCRGGPSKRLKATTSQGVATKKIDATPSCAPILGMPCLGAPTPQGAPEMTPPGAFESEGWIEAQARIARALDKLRADRKQQHELTRHVAEHTQEALECGATREQIADALDMWEHAWPEDAGT